PSLRFYYLRFLDEILCTGDLLSSIPVVLAPARLFERSAHFRPKRRSKLLSCAPLQHLPTPATARAWLPRSVFSLSVRSPERCIRESVRSLHWLQSAQA